MAEHRQIETGGSYGGLHGARSPASPASPASGLSFSDATRYM